LIGAPDCGVQFLFLAGSLISAGLVKSVFATHPALQHVRCHLSTGAHRAIKDFFEARRSSTHYVGDEPLRFRHVHGEFCANWHIDRIYDHDRSSTGYQLRICDEHYAQITDERWNEGRTLAASSSGAMRRSLK